jgi:hypothetical protein
MPTPATAATQDETSENAGTRHAAHQTCPAGQRQGLIETGGVAVNSDHIKYRIINRLMIDRQINHLDRVPAIMNGGGDIQKPERRHYNPDRTKRVF